MAHREGQGKPLPPWLVGLLLAVAIFVAVLFLLDFFGYGDDPVIGEGAAPAVAATL